MLKPVVVLIVSELTLCGLGRVIGVPLPNPVANTTSDPAGGTLLVSQLSAVVHCALAPPPSQVNVAPRERSMDTVNVAAAASEIARSRRAVPELRELRRQRS